MCSRCAGSTVITHWSYGTNLLYHLVAGAAGLAGGQVAVVTFLQVDAGLGGSLHFELVHSGVCLRDVDFAAFIRQSVSTCHQIIGRSLGIVRIVWLEKGGVSAEFVGNFFWRIQKKKVPVQTEQAPFGG